MHRRLYFLFPSPQHVRSVVTELNEAGVQRDDIHAVARDGIGLDGLPVATPQQRRDAAGRLERWTWRVNLTVFALALVAMVASITAADVLWAWVALLAMLASFVAGERFSTKIPNAHLDEFADALGHDEILLMVDVPKQRVAGIEALVHRRHPEATVGGVGWAIGAMGI